MIKIPELSSTNEAICFGLSYYQNKKVIELLRAKMLHYKADHQFYSERDDIQGMLDAGFKHQFAREALDTVQGKLQVQYLKYCHKEARFIDI